MKMPKCEYSFWVLMFPLMSLLKQLEADLLCLEAPADRQTPPAP